MGSSSKGLVVGEGQLAGAVVDALERGGRSVLRLCSPTDRELADAVADGPGFVAVISRDDVLALRWALVAEHARPGVRLVVTIFDRTAAAQIRRSVPNCSVLSLADAATGTLVGACLGGHPAVVPRARRLRTVLSAQLHPFDASSRLLVAGALGLVAVLAVDAALSLVAFGDTPLEALHQAVTTVTTVGPSSHAAHAPGWYLVVASALMLLSTALVAAATAGLINRALSRRLVSIVGRRALPRRDHVVVVGLGQVGLRLALELRRLGWGVVAIERDREAPLVHLAKRLNIPVVIGDGSERGLLERVRAHRARAVAAVTSDDLRNIAVAVTALAVHDRARVVVRAGDGDVVSESRALFPIGTICDVNRIAARQLADALLAADVDESVGRAPAGP